MNNEFREMQNITPPIAPVSVPVNNDRTTTPITTEYPNTLDSHILVDTREYITEEYEDIEDESIVEAINTIKETKLAESYNRNIQKPAIKELWDKLSSILKEYHFEIIEDDLKSIYGENVLGALDIIEKVVYLANNSDRGSLSDIEEFAHAFIELMGSAYHKKHNRQKFPETALYSELRDNIEQTSLYQETFEDYKDIYLYENGKPDLVRIKKRLQVKLWLLYYMIDMKNMNRINHFQVK